MSSLIPHLRVSSNNAFDFNLMVVVELEVALLSRREACLKT
jgi:hypothetical protein